MKKISRFLLLSLLISAGIATAFAVSKDEIQTQIQATKKQLSDTKRRENSVLGTLIKTQKDLEKASSNLEDLNRKMGATEGQIAVISAQLNSAQAELEKIKTLVGGKQKFLDQRLVALYKHGYQSSLEVLFNAKDFAEFIFRFEMISDYIQGDLQVIRALQAQQDTIAKKKEEIASRKQELAYKKNLYLSMQSQTRAEQDRMLQLNKIKQKELEMLQNNKKALEESLDELEETSKQVEAQIKEYQSQNHVALGTGKYIWP
ncbi:MAG: murein hydrolase activator EnvC family protein, partial [Bacillota bacterium]